MTNGLKVAVEHLGAELPFQLVDHQAARGSASGCFSSLKNMAVRMILRLLGFYIWMGGILLRLLGLISVVRFTSERSSNAKSWKVV